MAATNVTRRMCALYWSIARLGMFVRLRLFALFSALLLDNQSSGRLRAGLLRLNGARVGKNCFVRGKLLLLEGFDLTLGDDVFINSGCCLDFAAPIRIGNRVQISFQVSLITGDHHIGGHEQRAGRVCPRSIVIEDGAWIGARATILPGVRIGAGAIVGAGALVTKDVAPDTLVIGVPASVHRELSAEGDADS